MAALCGVTHDRVNGKLIDVQLEIEPITPSLDGLRDAYRVRIGPNEEDHMFESVLVLHSYQSAHETFRYFAEILLEVDVLLKLPRKHVVIAPIAMCYSLWWADFWITNATSPKEPHAVNLDIYVYDENEESNPKNGFVGDRCTAFGFRTTVEEAKHFGNSLMEELIAAWRMRQELGISVDDEAENWPEYFKDDPKWSAYFRED